MWAAALLSVLMAAGGEVTVPTRTAVGTVLEAAHLVGEPADIKPFLGRQLTRTIFAGRRVSLADTKEADMVTRNGMVRLIGRKGTLRVETVGRALGEGPVGMEIRVMNMESRRVVIGRIIGPNLVEVRL